jgi:hypothetical protein
MQDTHDSNVHVTDRNQSSSHTHHQANDVQQAMQEEDLCSDDFRNSSSSGPPAGHRSNDFHHGSTPIISNATPFSTSRTTCRQSIMTALSPGPPRMTGSSSPYPDDDPSPPTRLCGYGTPSRDEFTGPSLHLKTGCDHVCWQLSHDKGPCRGNCDRFMKFVYKLLSDARTEFILLLNLLRTQFQATGFHHGLVPDIGEIPFLVDLTKSPVDATFMSNRDRPKWSNRCYWVNSHRELGFSLHRVLAVVSRDSAVLAPMFARVASEQSYGGNSLTVLNELLRLHFFPHIHGTRASSFDTVTSKKIAQGPSETIPEFERRFTLWLQSLRVYREFSHYQDSEVTMWFVNGLFTHHQLFLTQEYVDLKQFHLLHCLTEDEPCLPDRLQSYFLCEHL